ncbi:peroxide stress protein YaaA [Cellvibrio sp.]|uniref:peroxide stress protein YaaA n=1 Tax=Cellvibrio sp. TaxID=1965322 RepID=UPI0039648727
MLLLISPAKTLDFETPAPTTEFTQADFLKQSKQLVSELRVLAPQDISKLMSISDKLGVLNFDRFASWKTPFKPTNAKQAVYAFQGDVYTGMQAETFSQDDIQFAQQHLRILSGLYGLLRPLDLIQAYRLEMGTGFANSRGKNLYEFWGDSITAAANKQLKEISSSIVINLASNEYFSAIKPKSLKAEIITPVFKDQKNGQYKIISFFAKKARGMMSAYIIQNRITEPEAIKHFNVAGYAFEPSQSSEREWVFIRDEIPS